MKNLETINSLVQKLENSIFAQYCNETSIDFENFPYGLCCWLNRELFDDYDNPDKNISLQDLINDLGSSVPAWQRDNDKWTEERQCSFILNLLKSFSTSKITLYYFKGEVLGKRNSNILDGLQRITALYKFFTGNLVFNIDGNKVTSSELLQNENVQVLIRKISVRIKFIMFNNEIEAIDHYIEINENISHSYLDILRAKEYRQKLISELQTKTSKSI